MNNTTIFDIRDELIKEYEVLWKKECSLHLSKNTSAYFEAQHKRELCESKINVVNKILATLPSNAIKMIEEKEQFIAKKKATGIAWDIEENMKIWEAELAGMKEMLSASIIDVEKLKNAEIDIETSTQDSFCGIPTTIVDIDLNGKPYLQNMTTPFGIFIYDLIKEIGEIENDAT